MIALAIITLAILCLTGFAVGCGLAEMEIMMEEREEE